MIRKICVISNYYPTKTDPHYAFVGNLVEQFAEFGVECHVITPVSYIERKHKTGTRIEKTSKGAEIRVYCPRFFQFPSRNILGYETYRLTVNSMVNAASRTFFKYIGSCDVIYSHFIESGIIAAFLKKKTGISAFMAVGESSLEKKKLQYTVFHEMLFNNLNGVVSVSSQLEKELLSENIIPPYKPVLTLPNGIDISLFQPLDREKCRQQLHIMKNDFVISFVGGFIKRKGFDIIQRILQKHHEWKCILIGTGDMPVILSREQVVFAGRLRHEEIPYYLNASDVFVLPTKAEGCCNAIIEAMGCGLPIISSNREFNYDILNKENAVLVDPDNEIEIENAINTLYENDDFRMRLATFSASNSKKYSIQNRAKAILQFMEHNK